MVFGAHSVPQAVAAEDKTDEGHRAWRIKEMLDEDE
jgi:hypothetical protein